MGKKRIDREKIVSAFLSSAFDKSSGATSLQDISDILQIKKASLYNHFTSKDEMYEASLVYCSDYLRAVNFLPEDLLKDDKIFSENVYDAFNKIIKRYIQLYETEPLFQIFTFIHTEKYFNKRASDIADEEIQKIEEGIFFLLKGFIKAGKLVQTEKLDLKNFAAWFSSALLQLIDSYIMHKKEIVRQNPESGPGSLFALPTDDNALNDIIQLSQSYLKIM